MQKYRSLKVRERAHALTLAVYDATSVFPASEMFGLTAQLRRACVSAETSIGEGCGRGSTADFARFLDIAVGSINEAENLVLIARDLRYLEGPRADDLEARTTEIRKMLWSLLRRLRS